MSLEENQLVVGIDEKIYDLDNLKRRWASEVGAAGSGMKNSDVEFVERQIQKLLKIRTETIEKVYKVLDAVKKHTEDW